MLTRPAECVPDRSCGFFVPKRTSICLLPLIRIHVLLFDWYIYGLHNAPVV